MDSATTRHQELPSLQARLETRDAALWVSAAAIERGDVATLAELVRLPWRLVILAGSSSALEAAIGAPENAEDSLVRRRGYPLLITQNPTEITPPPRSLPIYRLSDPDGDVGHSLSSQLRRLTVLDTLRRSDVRELVLLEEDGDPIPGELRSLWEEGFRPTISVVGSSPDLFDRVDAWRTVRASAGSATVVPVTPDVFAKQLVANFLALHAEDRLVVRLRDSRGATKRIDLTGVDDPQHPILGRYGLIQETDLQPVEPGDLSAEEVADFFGDATSSWRAYAAGLPWDRHGDAWNELRGIFRQLDRRGPEANIVAYIRAESGSGGTTLARTLAWIAAREGYPALFAKQIPFEPASLEVASFMTRALEMSGRHEDETRLYETPWLIVFDREHWEGKDAELRNFVRGLEQSGRPVCVLVVMGPQLGFEVLGSSKFVELGTLSHEVPTGSVVDFGRHINRYLAPHGPVRSEAEWRGFFNASVVHAESGISSFWVALSFWLQRQIDMTETVQSWMFKTFQAKVTDPELRSVFVDIAAMSTERRPLPDTLLPPTRDWPVTTKLEDLRSEVAGLGLLRLRLEGERYWTLVHDVLGRFLLNAIYFNPEVRRELGFEEAQSSLHLRFLALRRLAARPSLALAVNKPIAEDFAVNVFKIDPDHGHSTFALFWREALEALDGMPQSLWRTSRALRHHSAISRRRIAKDASLFPISDAERVGLLERAIVDIRFALDSIPRADNDEPDLNLWNSLARGYQDLQLAAGASGAPSDQIEEYRRLSQEATRRAWQLNPDSPFVVETLALGLLGEAKVHREKAGENAIEVLNLVYPEMERNRSAERRFELSRYAEEAFGLLLEAPESARPSDNGDINLVIAAIRALAGDLSSVVGMSLSDFPPAHRIAAAQILSAPETRENLQATRMLYALRCLDAPQAFEEQLEILERLRAGGYPMSPQQKLELAVLLYQGGRYEDGDRLFRQLRDLWRAGDHFAQVPERLRWLLNQVRSERLLVTARVLPPSGTRSFARVREMRDQGVPFRAEEFGLRQLGSGTDVRGYVSFGHNGPFLRPSTATAG